MNKVIVIDGRHFYDLDSFYDEIDNVLTKNLKWKTGHNLNAFNDLLYGGFGIHEYEEPITIVWEHSIKSISDLGYTSTVTYYKSLLSKCHTSNIDKVKAYIDSALANEGETLFDIIINIIKDHKDIELILK